MTSPSRSAFSGAKGQLDPSRLADFVIMGELALDGEVRSIKRHSAHRVGSQAARLQGRDRARANAREAAIVHGGGHRVDAPKQVVGAVP